MKAPTIDTDFCSFCAGWDGKKTRPRTCVRIYEPQPEAVCLPCIAVLVERAMREIEAAVKNMRIATGEEAGRDCAERGRLSAG